MQTNKRLFHLLLFVASCPFRSIKSFPGTFSGNFLSPWGDSYHSIYESVLRSRFFLHFRSFNASIRFVKHKDLSLSSYLIIIDIARGAYDWKIDGAQQGLQR